MSPLGFESTLTSQDSQIGNTSGLPMCKSTIHSKVHPFASMYMMYTYICMLEVTSCQLQFLNEATVTYYWINDHIF